MPVIGEVQTEPTLTNIECKVQMNLANMDCVGHNDLCKNESHGRKTDRELFFVNENDLDCIDIDELY